MNFYGLALEAQRRAAAKGIELLPTLPEVFADPEMGVEPHDKGWTGDSFLVKIDAPKGHYLHLRDHPNEEGTWAQIIAVDCFRPQPGTYTDLLPGFRISDIQNLGVDLLPPEIRDEQRTRFVSILYVRDCPR